MTRYWVSWYQPTEDFRPLSDPPNANILGWWCSGERCADGAPTLCALVAARGKAAAKVAIRTDWPEATEWRSECPWKEQPWHRKDRNCFSRFMDFFCERIYPVFMVLAVLYLIILGVFTRA